MDNITINTKIPLRNIINNVMIKQPKNKCEFNNLLLLEMSKIFFDDSKNEQLQILNRGGSNIKLKLRKSIKNKTKSKLNKQNKSNKLNKLIKTKTRSIRKIKQKGGTDPRIIIFFISLFFVFSKGIKNMSDSDVINRIKEVNNVSILFKNDYGTCAVNSLLFLKTIDLPTFEELSINIIEDKINFNRFKIGSYLNKELHIHSKWYLVNVKSEDKNLRLGLEFIIQNYIDKIKNKLIELRKFYNFSENQSIITEMNFPSKSSPFLSHSVVVWLTSQNELVIIDPQKFIKNELVLFTDNPFKKGIMYNDEMIKISPIKDYIKQNIDLLDNTYIFESIHIEIEDKKGDSILDKENINLQKTLTRIQEAKENRKLANVEL